MIQFKGMDNPVSWETWKKEHLKENTDEADAKFMDGLRKDTLANAKLGNEFNVGSTKQSIIQNLFKDDIDINHFANKKNFKLSDGEMGTFKDVLMTNPEAQQAIMKQIAEDPNLLKISDVDGLPGFSQSDLNMLIANEKLNKFDNSMSELVDAIVNPKNLNYDKEFAQNILGDAISMELKQTSHQTGTDVYNRGSAQVINRGVDNAMVKDPNLTTAENYSENGAFDLGKLNRINPNIVISLEDTPVMKTVDGKEVQDGEKTEKQYVIRKRETIDGTTNMREIKRLRLEPNPGYSFSEYLKVLGQEFKLELGSKNANI